MNKNAILIRITHHYNPKYTGLNELETALNKEYFCQSRPKWIPSYSEGTEFWLDVFINSPAFEFIKNLVISGLTWDLIKIGVKKINLKPLVQSIDHFLSQNDGNIDFNNIMLEFDDITIKIIGLNKNFIPRLSLIFRSLFKEIPYLQNQGLQDISRIVLPLTKYEYDNQTKYRYGLELDADDNEYLCNWEIITGFGCQKYIYDLKNKTLIEYYEKIG